MYSSKYISSEDLQNFADKLKESADIVVFTNGCFDLLHPGHIKYLAKARELGDILVVGLNSDESVRSLKGKERPINTFHDRVVMLEAMESVSHIIGFEAPTPLELIQKIRPDILVKGGDYEKDDIVGADFVESYGGKVSIIPFEEGYSSTALITKIKKQED